MEANSCPAALQFHEVTVQRRSPARHWRRNALNAGTDAPAKTYAVTRRTKREISFSVFARPRASRESAIMMSMWSTPS